ncbi:unnamed protein product [Microthlaspi erraticum]|uniref:Late embryogenesis abundant protein LEA-2 subgroup domain-containing protein n=1 Tax=Microthlaspi erraticum TaxID=1685480 RepID=A0A6D2JTQ0_9BRAS|nr:unnamed protein product [Microthlaspi erraticum]CAA7047922.1 unnamed protein product [Microthlaspi erraticum]
MSSLEHSPPETPSEWFTPTNTLAEIEEAPLGERATEEIPSRDRVIQQTMIKKTKPWCWCIAGVMMVMSILLIISMIAIVAIRPRTPRFDIQDASLHSSNLDLEIVARFLNRNKKMEVKLESGGLQLKFNNYVIAAQDIQPFSLTKSETRLEPIHLISLLPNVLPLKDEMDLQRQVVNNHIVYEVEGTFKVKSYFGFLHFSSTLVGIV